jgi:hypothetical protein
VHDLLNPAFSTLTQTPNLAQFAQNSETYRLCALLDLFRPRTKGKYLQIVKKQTTFMRKQS